MSIQALIIIPTQESNIWNIKAIQRKFSPKKKNNSKGEKEDKHAIMQSNKEYYRIGENFVTQKAVFPQTHTKGSVEGISTPMRVVFL